MLQYLEISMFRLMGYPQIMAIWVSVTSMFYLLQVRAHCFRPQGTFRLFVTAAIMGITIPAISYVLGYSIDAFLDGTNQRMAAIAAGPFLIILAFALAVTLIQRFLGADAETALGWAWPITVITYVIPIVLFFGYSVFHQRWLTGQADTPY